jgi:putative FmdB family regulatory protein
MPLFDFRCKNCGAEFEALVLGSDRPCCPECGKNDLEKLMSTFAVGGKGERDANTSGGSKSSGCAGCAGGSCASCH